MALEQLSLSSASPPVDGDGDGDQKTDAVPVNNGVDGRPINLEGGGEDSARAARLPRWTRQEILVLIQGKKVAENRVRRGRASGLGFGSSPVEPKWASVSSYCRRHGVNRGPVQCRKRWSNLSGDFKKIKEWESHIKEESESFWVMRNDLRRERKLPGFFDKEVYDILDGGAEPMSAPVLALGLAPSSSGKDGDEEEEEEEDPVFDSGRSAAAEDGLFSDFEQSVHDEIGRSHEKESAVKDAAVVAEAVAVAAAAAGSPYVPAPIPISEKQYQPYLKASPGQGAAEGNEKQPGSNPEIGSTSQEGRKRKRTSAGADDDAEWNKVQDHLIEVLERNGRMLNAQLETQNTNSRLDREQRKDHAECLVAVLNKLADALGRIAEKL
ncbi:Myb/SANT-like DNA-binding domain 4 [Dillenia turbinata]|uniref:Myb/SANT-like DNA-binding domain 4 n=1 Tax=Dillenia turbinata TaxID=194707 RepID=A0AAN8Z2R0_9MAGN